MLVAATALLERNSAPHENEVMDAIGGVLCRCTGYRKIIAAILDAGLKDAGVEHGGSTGGPGVSHRAGVGGGKRRGRVGGRQKDAGRGEVWGEEDPDRERQRR